MTRHYPDLGSASDWLKQIPHAARSIRHTTHTQTHFCVRFSDVISWETSGGIGLGTNITKNCLKIYQEIPGVFLNISKFSSKYLKNIWLRFINITVKTQQYSLSSKMATQISANFRKLYFCTAYSKL